MLLTLLEPEATDIDLQNKRGEYPLHIAVTDNRYEAVKCLLEEGCSPDVVDATGKTALMHACQTGRPRLVSLLLASNADTMIRDAKGWTADDIAIMASQDECRDLIQHFNSQLQSPCSDISASEGAAAAATSRQQIPHTGEGIGAPALDEPEPISDRDNTASKMSEAGDTSWNDDTDDDVQPRGRPILLEQMEEVKVEKDSAAPAPASAASVDPSPPMSARSNASALSMGAGVDSNWSNNDEDSLFSSMNESKGNVSLVNTQQARSLNTQNNNTQNTQNNNNLSPDQPDSWGDDNSDDDMVLEPKFSLPQSKLAQKDKTGEKSGLSDPAVRTSQE